MSTSPPTDGIANLIERLGHADRLERVHAAVDLVRLGRRGCRLEEALAAALKDERPVVRKMAALVLGDLAPDSRMAIPALAEALVTPMRACAAGRPWRWASSARRRWQPYRRCGRRWTTRIEGVRSFAAASLALIEPQTRHTRAA